MNCKHYSKCKKSYDLHEKLDELKNRITEDIERGCDEA